MLGRLWQSRGNARTGGKTWSSHKIPHRTQLSRPEGTISITWSRPQFRELVLCPSRENNKPYSSERQVTSGQNTTLNLPVQHMAQSDDGGVSVSRECLERYFRGKSIRCDCRRRSRQPDTRAAVVKTTTPATRRRRFKILVMGSRPKRTPPTPENVQSPVTAQR